MKIDKTQNNNSEKWIRRFSPCMLVAILCLGVVIYGFAILESTEGWSLIIVFLGVVAMFGFLLLDGLTKLLMEQQTTRMVWQIQVIMIVLCVFICYGISL